MAEAGIDERFARFEAEVPATFRPAPLAEVAARARRRRRLRRALFAGVLAIAVGAPAGAVAVAADHDGRPSPFPPPVVQLSRPPASATPEPIRPIERTAALPGVDMTGKQVYPVDATHAWVWYVDCTAEDNPGSCRYALGSTSDGGVTWHRANLPNLAADKADVIPIAVDARTFAFYALHKRFWQTTDGGASFSSYPATAPPRQALSAWARDPGDAFTLLCPGAIGFEDGASGIECDREQVVRIGSGPVPHQPTLPGRPAEVLQAGDGRIWLITNDGPVTRVAVSTDDSRTWTEVGSVPGQAALTVSPDGADVWLVEGHTPDAAATVWRLTGTRFVAQAGSPEDLGGATAMGGGMLVGAARTSSIGGSPGYWFGGAFHWIPGLQTTGCNLLRDGTIACYGGQDQSFLLGVGTGTERTWYRLA